MRTDNICLTYLCSGSQRSGETEPDNNYIFGGSLRKGGDISGFYPRLVFSLPPVEEYLYPVIRRAIRPRVGVSRGKSVWEIDQGAV